MSALEPTLKAPDGFEWVPWDAALACSRCGVSVSAFRPGSVEREQQMYDAWAASHRGVCRA